MPNFERILVTGATGMIGANLVRQLLASNDSADSQVFATHRHGSDLWRLADVSDQLQLVECDLLNSSQIDQAIEFVRPDCIFHLASSIWGLLPAESSNGHVRTNVLGTEALLEAVRRHCPQSRIVFSGSSAAYGTGEALREDQLPAPTTIYGVSKAAVSLLLQTYCRLYGMNVVELRLFTPFGPWEQERRLIPHVVTSLLSGRNVQLTSGTQQRDFVYIDDVVRAMLMAAERQDVMGEIFNIGSGTGISVREAAETVWRIVGRQDVSLEFGAVAQRSDEMFVMSADISKANRMLNWRPLISFDEGISRTIQWFSNVRLR